MFQSFFPSVVIWSIVVVAVWYMAGNDLGLMLGFDLPQEDVPPVIGIGHFTTVSFLWFYLYYAIITAIFAGFWFYFSPHRWQFWSILGSALILFSTYFGVQVSVAINNWRRPFFDAVQNALNPDSDIVVTAGELYSYFVTFAEIAFLSGIKMLHALRSVMLLRLLSDQIFYHKFNNYFYRSS